MNEWKERKFGYINKILKNPEIKTSGGRFLFSQVRKQMSKRVVWLG